MATMRAPLPDAGTRSPSGGDRHAAKPPSAQRNPASRDGMEACSAAPSAPPSTAMLVDPKKKECVAELVGPGCAQPEPARAVGLDALIGIVQASCERALTARVAECGKVRRRILAGETPSQ